MKDMLIKFDKLLFIIDFIILDMDDVNQTYLNILGQSFLIASRIHIDIHKGNRWERWLLNSMGEVNKKQLEEGCHYITMKNITYLDHWIEGSLE